MIRKTSLFISLFALLSFISPLEQAAAANVVAELVKMTGRVDILRNGKLPSEKAKVGTKFFVGDFIRTKSKSSAEVLFSDGNRIRIEPRSRVDINNYSSEKDERTINLARGRVEAVVIPAATESASERPKRFEIQTPNAVAGVRGTTILVAFQNSITAIHVKKASSGRSVYSISRSFPNEIVNVPIGGMMWVRNQGAPTLMPPGSNQGFSVLMQALAGLGDLGDLGVLADAIAGSGQNIPTVVSEAFPQALGVEVGVVNMSGSKTTLQGYTLSLQSIDTHFYALDANSTPFYWEAPTITGTWTPPAVSVPPPFNPIGESFGVGGGATGENAFASFSVSSWDATTGSWTASIDSGNGEVPNGSLFLFNGSASGSGATDQQSGSFSGSGSGIAVEDLQF